jgi:molybdate transport system substrate-binding protein
MRGPEDAMKLHRIIAVTIALGLPFMLAQAQAAEIKLLASNALKAVLEELAPQFEKTTEHKLAITFGSTGTLSGSINKGTPFDLTILGADALDDFIKKGKLVASTRTALARSGIGVAYRKGAPKPDIATTESFKRALLSAKSLSFSSNGLSGSHMMRLLDRLDIAAQVKPKVVTPAVSASIDVAKGVAELGMTQVSEILPHASEGTELAGPLPAELQLYTIFATAVGSDAKQPDAAKALIRFLTAPAAITLLKTKGLEPG